jgi:DNA-directed RNA polymerase specialized sigma24 family protein
VTTADGPGVHDWVVHRPNIVRSVAARVPGIDAEEATSRALEKMVRIVSTGGTIDDPAPYWRRAAVNEAISMTREAGRARPVEDDTFDGLTPPVAGAELDAERLADVSMLRTALSDLAEDDRQILLERHVHRRAVTDIATGLGVRPHAVTMRLRRAEERLAGAFAAAHAQAVNEPECRTTRAAMHDYLKGRLLPRRQERLEVHMDGCTECTRAFIDVREVSWMLRDLGQHFIGGVFVTGSVGGAAVGGAAVVGAGPRAFGKRETSVAAGVVAALVVGGAAAAYLNNQTDPPPQAVVDLSGGGSAAAQPPTQDPPPAFPPADPQPRPATTPKEDAAPAPDPAPAPEQDVSEPAPEPELEPEPEPALEPAGAEPAPAPDERAPADTPAQPAPEQAVDPPAPEPEPAPKPEPEPEPETQPAPNPPQGEPMSGPPGNPDNGHGMGPTTYSDQGPGNGDGKGQAPDRIDTVGADLGEQLTTLLAVPSVAAAPGIVLLGGTPTQRGLPDAPDSIAT